MYVRNKNVFNSTVMTHYSFTEPLTTQDGQGEQEKVC